ncbi:MAG: hypothetical protein RLZZ387_3588 [Chloroflexota bacterium]|jgi:hypothetical protein
MPFPSDDIKITNPDGSPAFVLLDADATVRDALAALPSKRSSRAYTYVVLPLRGRQFLVPRWIEVELLAIASGRDITDMRIADLPALLGQIDPAAEVDVGGKWLRASALTDRFAPVQAVEQNDTTMSQGRALRDAHPAFRLVILRGGQVLGLYLQEILAGSGLPGDPFQRTPAFLAEEATAGDEPPMFGIDDKPPVLNQGGGGAPQPAASQPRTINGWIEGAETAGTRSATWRVIAKDEPLLLSAPYELKFDIDAPRATSLVTGGNIETLAATMQEDETIELLVELSVDKSEFDIYGRKNATLYLRKSGPSLNRVTFSITPKQTGKRTVKALLYTHNELFQEFSLTFTVTDKLEQARPGTLPGAITTQQTGIDLGSAIARRTLAGKDRVSLVIVRQTKGYEFILQGPVVKRAIVTIEPQTLIDSLANIRNDFLNQIVMRKDEATQTKWPYLEPDTKVAEAEHQKSLKILAGVGRRMFRSIFENGEGGADVAEMGQLIRELSQRHELSVQVVADRFNFPWAMLYDREEINPPAPEGFWGFKHIIQYLPEYRRGDITSFSPALPAAGGRLPMAFICDSSIDGQFKVSVVGDQKAFLSSLPTVTPQIIETKDEVFELLGGTDAPPFIYFYCHAESMLPGEQGKTGARAGVDASYITVTNGGKITLEELKDEAHTGRPRLKSAPFVFLNACQGAELSPEQYAGLLPYFIARGARGAIGTEVNTPVNFGAEFARKFIEELAKGERSVGEILLELRKWYLNEQRNVCGLVYALHSSGDLIVERS